MHNGNPHLSCMFLNEETLIASGFDKIPYMYKKEGGAWKMSKMLDQGITKVREAKVGGNSFVNKRVHFNPDIKL